MFQRKNLRLLQVHVAGVIYIKGLFTHRFFLFMVICAS